MLKNTDLDSCKKVALSMLNKDIEVTIRNGRKFISHPFFDYTDGLLYNITEDKDGYNIVKNNKEELINKLDNYMAFSVFITKPYRMLFLKLTKNHLNIKDFSNFLIDAWINDENANRNINIPKKELLGYFKKAEKDYLMNKSELDIYSKLDDIVTVYRGVTDYNKDDIKALSWTLEIEKAEWFAERYSEAFDQSGYVFKAKINKKDILAFCDQRDEKEIILDYTKLYDIELLYEIDL